MNVSQHSVHELGLDMIVSIMLVPCVNSLRLAHGIGDHRPDRFLPAAEACVFPVSALCRARDPSLGGPLDGQRSGFRNKPNPCFFSGAGISPSVANLNREERREEVGLEKSLELHHLYVVSAVGELHGNSLSLSSASIVILFIARVHFHDRRR